jgi:predicted protein tyrosine phosphatase
MIIICSLADLPGAIKDEGPHGVVSLLGPELMIPELKGFEGRHLRLEMNDIAEQVPGQILPHDTHVDELLSFVDTWPKDAPLIIHCWAGISRSTAASLITQAHLHPDADEGALAADLAKAAPHARPNRRLVELADDILDRKGRLIEAAELVYRDEPVFEGVRSYYPLYDSR